MLQLTLYDGVFLRGAQKTRKTSNRLFFADDIHQWVKKTKRAVFGDGTYQRRNGNMPKNGKDPVVNHQQKQKKRHHHSQESNHPHPLPAMLPLVHTELLIALVSNSSSVQYQPNGGC